jgi:hypothetical protein
VLFAVGCGSSSSATPSVDGGDDDAGVSDAGVSDASYGDASDGSWGDDDDDDGMTVDGGSGDDGGADASAGTTYPAARFASKVISFDGGACDGFGKNKLPGVVLGPPVGGGASQGSLDVLSLGTRGSIVLGFDDVIVDGPGADFLVFENPFLTNGQPDFELAQVSVSDDGTTWTSFPCTATGVSASGYGTCAGWHPVYSSPANGISPLDPAVAGGDPFDLSLIGVTEARFVRIDDVGVDYTAESCPAGSTANANGFDLDAVSIVNTTPGTP